MALMREAVDRLFDDGAFAEIIALAERHERDFTTLDPEVRVAVAHAFALVGDFHRASALARLEIRENAPPTLRSRAESVLGIACERQGLTDDAFEHFNTSIRLAVDSNEAVRIAWARLYLFRLLIEGHPRDSLLAMMAEVRKSVLRASNPQATAYLHACVAILEGQTGRITEAQRHCVVTEAILEHTHNEWLSAMNLANRACVAWLSCDFVLAVKYLRDAKGHADQSGHQRMREAIEGNLGHIEMITGQFERAKQSYSRLLRSEHLGGAPTASVLEGLARVHLATRELAACEETLEQLASVPSPNVSYHLRWAGITKARLLIQLGRHSEALGALTTLEERIDQIRDVLLAKLICTTKAQVLRELNQPYEAALALMAADSPDAAHPDTPRTPDFLYVAGLCASNTQLAGQLTGRAVRQWSEEGLVSVRLEVDASIANVDVARRDLKRARTSPPPYARTPACVADAMAAVFDVAQHPRLLGAELVALIRGLDCSPDVKVIETRHTDPREVPGALSLQLGTLQQKAVTLTCAAPTTPDAAVLLGSVLRIGRAALALEHARQEERSRAALWPASPVEEQAGALFLAEGMQDVLATARRIATTNVPVLITGETGTGKEVLARTIHGYSPRATRTFLPFNCSATPREMLDAQLFGHRRGAFTGATENFSGIIRAAAGGTLFLDEIGETSLEVQPKLLRFLESGEVHPIGETHPVKADVRVIAATNADLDALMAEGRFRQDLFYRLNIVKLHLPPLRERSVEIPPLAHHYLQKYATECGKKELRFSEETMEYLVLYRWPGNVRQLANEMRRMAALAEDGAVLMPEHLSREIAASRRTLPASERPLETTELVVRMDQPMSAAVHHLEQSMIQYALTRCGGHMEETAALLGLSRKGLYLKRQRFGLDVPPDHVGVA